MELTLSVCYLGSFFMIFFLYLSNLLFTTGNTNFLPEFYPLEFVIELAFKDPLFV